MKHFSAVGAVSCKQVMVVRGLALGIFLLTIFSTSAPILAAMEVKTEINVSIFTGDQLAVGECSLQTAGNPLFANNPASFKPNGNLRLTFSFPNSTKKESAIYSVGYANPADFGKTVKVLFRMPQDSWRKMREKQGNSFVGVILEPLASGTEKIAGRCIPIIKDGSSEFATLTAEWRQVFLGVLENEISLHEDHELELLLYLRWAGNPPTASFTSWTQDRAADFIWNFCGVNDVRSALPPSPPKALPGISQTAYDPPTPMELPKVTVPPVELDSDISSLAAYVPNDCYYVEWPTWGDFRKSLFFLAEETQKWSSGFFPWPVSKLIDRNLESLGLTGAFIEKNFGSGIGPVVLAGRDPFFAGGTSVVLIIKGGQRALPIPPGNPLAKKLGREGENLLLVANGPELFRVVSSLPVSGKPLREEPGFRYSRKRLATVSKGRKEWVFLYLSDPWFANLLSPRWMIQNLRLNRLDARIRLTELLKLVWMREHGLSAPPSLAEVRARPLLSPDWASWLLDDLEDGPSGIRSKTHGGLYEHLSIDCLPFVKVSLEEFEYYNTFQKDYLNRWKKMDPVALQLVQASEPGKWISRLYVSPIAGNSSFRSNQFIRPTKRIHNFVPRNGQFFGVSFSHESNAGEGVGGFIRLWGFDAAPTSFPPKYWLEKRWPEDQISLYRTPFAVSLNDPGWIALLKMILQFEFGTTDFPGIQKVGGGWAARNPVPIFVTKEAEKGFEMFSWDLATLHRLMATGTEKFRSIESPVSDSEIPATVRAFLDLRSGAMFRRFLIHSGVQDRGIESWRRENRLRRIGRLLGLEFPAGLQSLTDRHIFPSQPVVHPELLAAIPRERGENTDPGFPNYFELPSGLLKTIESLPGLMTLLRRLDFFISQEENALFFETHADIADSPSSLSVYGPATSTDK